MTQPALAADVTIAAAGDIACDPSPSSPDGPYFGLPNGPFPDRCHMGDTASLIKSDPSISAVLALGDEQYMNGAYSKFLASYDKTWGAFKAITHPVPGNHDWSSGSIQGYLDYFKLTMPTYYSFDIGDWHIVALDSNCKKIGGCTSTSPEGTWFKKDLESHPVACTLAFWHHPRFSSTTTATYGMKPFWNIAYSHNVDLILNGHRHEYERFAPQNPSGGLDTVRGIVQIIIGTGGKETQASSPWPGPWRPNSAAFNDRTFGIGKLTLHPGSYDFTYLSTDDSYKDTTSGNCH
jgi:hypothetical protein